MAQYNIKGPLTDDSLNKINHMFDELYKKYTGAGLDAAEAREKAIQAVADAEIAKETAETTREEMLAIIREQTQNGDLAPEIAQARQGKETLGENLNSIKSELAQTLQEMENTKLLALSYTKFGKVWFPPDYVDFLISQLPFNLFRDFTGKIKHDFNFKEELRGTKIYIRKYDANNNNDGLTESTAILSLQRAVEIANSINGEVTFVFLDKFSEAGPAEWDEFKNMTKDYSITSASENGTIFGTVRTGFNWLDDTSLFKVARSAAIDVYDYGVVDVNGKPKPFKKVNTRQECKDNYMSWYTDGTNVHINYDIESGINRDLAISVSAVPAFELDVTGRRVVIDKIKFMLAGKGYGSANGLRLRGNSASEVYINEALFSGANLNGLSDLSVGKLYVFDSVAINNGVDGFNYHGISSDFIFEYDCYGAFNGTTAQQSANATTAHDGMTILRIGSIGENCYGPVLADVGGCVSINIDCRMYNSLGAIGKTGAAFYFSDSGGTKPGVYWMINCEGGGEDTFTLYAPTINANPVNVINLKGLNIEPDTRVNYVA